MGGSKGCCFLVRVSETRERGENEYSVSGDRSGSTAGDSQSQSPSRIPVIIPMMASMNTVWSKPHRIERAKNESNCSLSG